MKNPYIIIVKNIILYACFVILLCVIFPSRVVCGIAGSIGLIFAMLSIPFQLCCVYRNEIEIWEYRRKLELNADLHEIKMQYAERRKLIDELREENERSQIRN